MLWTEFSAYFVSRRLAAKAMASSSFFPAHAGTKDLVEKYKGLIVSA